MYASSIPVVLRQPTGVFEFDYATGGGFPRGRYTIVYGPWSSGKTNIVYGAIAAAQRGPASCNKAVYVNVEGTFDPVWAAKFGVDVDALIIINGAYGEETVDLIDALIRAEDVAFLAVDSLASLVGIKEITQTTETADVGSSSLLIKRMCNKLMYAFNEEARRSHYPAVVLVNQVRYKIGTPPGMDPETIPGGITQWFLASLIVRLYGKNVVEKDIHPDLTAFKDTSAIIKKSKVPIMQNTFKYKQVMYAHEGMAVGDTDSWNMVAAHLKAMGSLENTGKGWSLEGTLYPKLAPIEDRYRMDVLYRIHLQQLIIDANIGKGMFVDDTHLINKNPTASLQPGEGVPMEEPPSTGQMLFGADKDGL